MPNQRWSLNITMAIATLLATADACSAARIFCHRAVRCNQCNLSPYAYDRDHEQSEASVVAIASADQPVPAPVDTGSTRVRKHFYVTERESITVDDIQLGRFGLSIDDNGRCYFTGMLSFGGDVEAAKRGANAILKVRLYMGTPQHPGTLENMALLCQTQHPIWVPRGRSQAVSLLPSNPIDYSPPPHNRCCSTPKNTQYRAEVLDASRRSLQQLVKDNFQQITHIEIVLAHGQDK